MGCFAISVPRRYDVRIDSSGGAVTTIGVEGTFASHTGGGELTRYEGWFDDLAVLAHEGGHAVQNMLMDRRGVLPSYATGPEYFTESFAGFAELLLVDHLARTAPSRAERLYFVQRFIDQATEVFKAARETRFERDLYAADPGGSIPPDTLEACMQPAGRAYSLWFGPGGERTCEWVNAIHFYTRPLYRMNYVYSKLLALVYFERWRRQDERFLAGYRDLLGHGYDAPPAELLRRLVHIDLAAPDLVPEAMRPIEAALAALEDLDRAAR